MTTAWGQVLQPVETGDFDRSQVPPSPFAGPAVPNAAQSIQEPSLPTYPGRSPTETFSTESVDQPPLPLPPNPLPGQAVATKELLIPYWVVEEKKPSKAQADRAYAAELQDLIMAALTESPFIQGQLLTPRIRDQEAQQARGVFDPNRFANSIWSDRSDPVGSTLATGGASRLNETNLQNSLGVRKKNELGGSLEASQDLGFRNNNSLFFTPKDQADAKMLLRYTQPLMKGAGRAYNTAFIGIAQLQTGVAEQDAQQALQNHVWEITKSYWELYYSRSQMVQQKRGLDRLIDLSRTIESRSEIDSIRSQRARATSEVQKLQAKLTRSSASVIQSESLLRAKVNASSIQHQNCDEIIPVTEPLRVAMPIEPEVELQNALQYRPEVLAIRNEIKAANIRLKVAQNELKPTLNLVTDLYVHGLNGRYDAAQSYADQYSRGRPSYSGGLEYSRPRNQIAAKAIQNQRNLEMRQLLFKLDNRLLEVSADILSAIAEVDATFVELLNSGQASTLATTQEVEYLEAKWRNSPLLEPSQVSQNLDQLIDAELRLIEAENNWANSQMRYMIALARLQYTTGTLLSVSAE